MTVFWSSVLAEERKIQRAGSSSLIRRKKSRSKAKSSLSALAVLLKTAKFVPSTLRRAIVVLFGKYAGTEIKIEGDEFLMMREEDILGVSRKFYRISKEIINVRKRTSFF